MKKFSYFLIFGIVIGLIFFIGSNIYATDTEINVTQEEIPLLLNSDDTQNVTSQAGIYSEFKDNTVADLNYIDGIYKTSDDKHEIYLPYVRYAKEQIIVDRELNKSGLLFSQGSIDVNSKLNKLSVIFASDTLRINAPISYAVIYAKNVVIDSTIDNTVVILANNITITDKAVINDDLICFAESLTVDGNVKGSIVGSANIVNIKGTVEKDLRISSSDITFNDSKNVLGKIVVNTSNQALDISEYYPNAVVNYNVKETTDNTQKFNDTITDIAISSIVLTLLFLAYNSFKKKNAFVESFNKVKNHYSYTIVSGFIAWIVFIPAVIILLLLSFSFLGVITFPILMMYIALMVVAGVLAHFIVGSIIFRHMKGKYLNNNNKFFDIISLFFIFASVKLLEIIPTIGGFIAFSYLVISAGVILTVIFKKKTEIPVPIINAEQVVIEDKKPIESQENNSQDSNEKSDENK